LRGRILPVGGIREKALAARRAGVTTFVMPAKNENDLENIPKKLRQNINFIQVDRMHQVLDIVLLPPTIQKRRRTKAPALPVAAVPPA
jgi:ATP-dependent Lon protease